MSFSCLFDLIKKSFLKVLDRPVFRIPDTNGVYTSALGSINNLYDLWLCLTSGGKKTTNDAVHRRHERDLYCPMYGFALHA